MEVVDADLPGAARMRQCGTRRVGVDVDLEEADAEGVMRFHLGTLLEGETGAWSQATHRDGMALLDLEVPYDSLLTGAGPAAEQGLDVERLVALAQPVVDAVLAPGFPFALGASFILPTR